MIVVDLQGIFLPYCYPRFSKSISHESVTTDVESSLIPYLGLPVPPALPSVAHIIFFIFIRHPYTKSRIDRIPCVCYYSSHKNYTSK